MQKLITKYGLAAHLALLAVAPLFLSPTAVLWLTPLVLIWVVMEPSRRPGEMLHDARRRVFRSALLDPVFWLSVLVALLAAVRMLNDGIALAYDAEATIWSLMPAALPFLPGSVSGNGYPEFAAACAAIVLLQGARHGLGKAARLAFFLVATAISGAVAIALAIMVSMGAPVARSLLACSLQTPSYVGSGFAACLLAATVALVGIFERGWRRALPLAFLSIGGNLAGLLLFAPPWTAVPFAAVTLILFLYAFVYARKIIVGIGEFKMLVFFVLSLVIAGFLVVSVLPAGELERRLLPWTTGAFFPEGYAPMREALSAIALKVWKSSPWFGTGLGSFAFDIRFNATDADWALIQPHQLTALNAYWQLLAERGIVGAFVLACPFAFLAWTYVRRCVKASWRAIPHPACWLAPLLLVAVFAEAATDVSLLSPGVLCVTVCFMALSANSFSKEKHNG